MQIRWENIFGTLFLIFGIYMFVKLIPMLNRWLEEIGDGYYFYAETPTMKVMLLGLLCVSAVAIVKIIVNHRR